MLFHSYIFILCFLPLALTGYFIINHFHKYTLGLCYLTAVSLIFYGYYNPVYVLLLIGSIILNFTFSGWIHAQKETCYRKAGLVIGIILNLLLLLYFKYYNFFIENINGLFQTDWNLNHVLLPLGISFFTFQQLAYLMDTYHEKTTWESGFYGLIHYASYVTFFPHVSSGPIGLHFEIVPQLSSPAKKRVDYDNLCKGIFSFSRGLAKKILIADSLGRIADIGYSSVSTLSSLECVFVMISYTLQIYFDFSGYSDMAIGVGRMFNIELPENFFSPYKAVTIKEFWDKWHITLTRFFRNYVYFPLGGSRKGKWHTYLNVMIIFLLSGLWHGAAWTFVLWGALHGMALCFYRMNQKWIQKLPRILNLVITFLFVNLCWVFFRADSIRDAGTLIIRMCSGYKGGLNDIMITNFTSIPEITFLTMVLPVSTWVYLVAFVSITLIAVLTMKNTAEKTERLKYNVKNGLSTVILMVWCIISMSGVSAFLYFNF